MNYFIQLNKLWEIQLLNPISGNELALYLALLHMNNRLDWKERFNVTNKTLILLSGLPKTTMQNARNKLVQKGYINYYKGMSNNKAPEYEIIQLYGQNPGQNSGQNSGHIHKPNITETKIIKKEKVKKKKEKTALEVISEYGEQEEDDEIINLLIEFLKMRNLKKKPVTAYAMEMRIKELNRLTQDKEIQKQIINQSITSNWDRFYELTQQNRTGRTNNNITPYRNKEYSEEERKKALEDAQKTLKILQEI